MFVVNFYKVQLFNLLLWHNWMKFSKPEKEQLSGQFRELCGSEPSEQPDTVCLFKASIHSVCFIIKGNNLQ